MAQSLDIYIDTTNGNLVAAGSARNGTLPTLTRNDSYNLRVRLQERDTSGFLRDLDLTGSSIKLGIGGIDADPTDGQFRLVLNSITSSAISFNATTTQVYNAISAIASSGVGVTTYGNEGYSYLITSATANTAMSFGGSAFTLFPTSSVLVSTRRFPAPSVAAQQVIRLVRNPAVFADTFVASPTAGVVSLTKVQDGSSTKNETYDLAIGSDAEGGSVVLNYGANSTTAIPIGATAASFQEALTSITAISNGNISVDIGNNAGNYSISFVRNLGLTNITTALTLDASGVIFGNFLQTTVTMATAELDELFAEAGTDTISPKIEVELTQNGTPKTVLQTNVTVRRDLITTGSAVPAAQASYYTKAETNALFVEDSTLNVDATNRSLNDVNGIESIRYGDRVLVDGDFNEMLAYGSGLSFKSNTMGFYNSAVTAKPSGTNIVSGLTNLGLLSYTQPTGTNIVSSLTNIGLLSYTQPTAINVVSALNQTGLLVNNNTSTFGVFPLSSRTLTTTASLNFGTVGGLDQKVVTVPVTGALTNDIVLLGLPVGVTTGLIFMGHTDTTGVVAIDCANYTNNNKTQGALTFRITVIGY